MNSDNSDTTADIIPTKTPRPSDNYPADYKEKVFYIWYNHGKPAEYKLLRFIPPDLDQFHRVPTVSGLKRWIDVEFYPRARMLDDLVRKEMDEKVVAEKVEMLQRHAKIGKQMQDKAINFLNEYPDLMNSPAAVRLLVEGIRIERESVGVSTILNKIVNLTDEDLQSEVEKILIQGKLLEAENANADSGRKERGVSASNEGDTGE